MKKKPRFFCDNCGYEVGNSAKTCPHCGRFFASVRCPACGFSGEDKLFLKGCPSCGYSEPPQKRKKEVPVKSLTPSVYIISIIVLLIVVALLSYLITR